MNEIATIDSGRRSFCTFRADGRLYGIDVAHVREVNTHVAAAPVPQSPAGIRGLANLRSRIYLVIDLRPLLGVARVESTIESRLIILKSEVAEDVGILVDQGGDIVQVQRSEIDFSTATDSSSNERTNLPLTCGVCRLENELLVLIDPKAIIDEIAKQIR